MSQSAWLTARPLWGSGRASDSRLRESGFEANCFILLLSSSHSYMNEYLAIYTGGSLCTNKLRALTVAWLDASQRSRGGIRLNRLSREKRLKCKPL